MFIGMQYLGMAIRGIPYMGVGRNLAYRKDLFFRKKGFGAHNHIISGDDDLFVNANASGANTRVEFSIERQPANGSNRNTGILQLQNFTN
jgi:biofilm PGA synthesis N-glycosyltransferase PgaC